MYNTSSNFHTLYPFSIVGGINDVIHSHDVIVRGSYLKEWQPRQQQKVRDILCILHLLLPLVIYRLSTSEEEAPLHNNGRRLPVHVAWGPAWSPCGAQ